MKIYFFLISRGRNSSDYGVLVSDTVGGPKRDGVTGEWRKLHNEELNDLYS